MCDFSCAIICYFRMLSLCQYPSEMMSLFTSHVMTAPGLILHMNKHSPEVNRVVLFCVCVFSHTVHNH